MNSTAKLYSPEVLALATRLADWPPRAQLLYHGDARAPACGSRLSLDLDCDGTGRITQLGLKAQACAIGQASAAIFAEAAIGRTRAELAQSHAALQAWLAGEGELPDWPGLAAIAPARDFPGRHGAILLSWNAALAALPSV